MAPTTSPLAPLPIPSVSTVTATGPSRVGTLDVSRVESSTGAATPTKAHDLLPATTPSDAVAAETARLAMAKLTLGYAKRACGSTVAVAAAAAWVSQRYWLHMTCSWAFFCMLIHWTDGGGGGGGCCVGERPPHHRPFRAHQVTHACKQVAAPPRAPGDLCKPSHRCHHEGQGQGPLLPGGGVPACPFIRLACERRSVMMLRGVGR